MGLEGLATSVVELDPSPLGRWWLMSVLEEQFGGGSDYRALYVLDTLEENHWVASNQSWGGYSQHQWLPDGRLLWIEDGQLNVATADGHDRHTFISPSPIRELWAGPNGTVLLSAEESLWRLFLATGQWEQVTNAKEVSYPSANLQLSKDGTFAAAINDGEIRYIPLERGKPGRLLATIEYPGHGGRIAPPSPIPNSPYWFLQEVDLPNGTTRPMLLDSRDGSLHTFEEFVPGGISVPEPSPDGQWVYVWTTDAEGLGLYVTPSRDLRGGKIVYTAGDLRDTILWETDPDAVVVSPKANPLEALRFRLPSGERAPSPYQGGAPLNETRFILEPRDTTVGPPLVPGHQIRALSPDGETVAVLNLPPATARPVRIYQAGPSRVLIQTLTFEVGIDAQCQYNEILWQWEVQP